MGAIGNIKTMDKDKQFTTGWMDQLVLTMPRLYIGYFENHVPLPDCTTNFFGYYYTFEK